jgi:DNA-binding NarL/FixJ family response regulator
MSETRRLMIVEDHTLLRAALTALLHQDSDLVIVSEVDNGRDAIRAIGAVKPDLVLMDLSMPGISGIEAIAEIKRRSPETKVIALTVHKADEYIDAALRAGANGYVLKDSTHEELRMAIRAVLEGKVFLSPHVTGRVINSYLGTERAHVGGAIDSLTLREREVLKLVAEGRQNRRIAEYLSLSMKTVEKHRSNVMKKLDCRNAAMLTHFAMEHGLLSHAADMGAGPVPR